MTDLALYVVSETKTKLVLGHDPVPGAIGFITSPRVANGVRVPPPKQWAISWDGSLTEHPFAAGFPPYEVAAIVRNEDGTLALVAGTHPGDTVDPPVARPLGCVFNASGLANLEVGKWGRQVGFRFRATGARTKSLGWYCKIDNGSGYSAGDHGTTVADIYLADAAGLPTGLSLGRSAPLTKPASSGFPVVALNATLTPGSVYVVVFTNIGVDPMANYCSVNTMDCDPALSPPQPEVTQADFACLYRDQGGRWVEHRLHWPIFDLTYDDGTWQGNTYVDFRSQSGKIPLGTVTQTFTPPADRTVSRVHVFVGGAGTLTATVAGQQGQVQVAARGWAVVTVPAVTVKRGTSFRVTVSSSGGLSMFPYTKGSKYGWHDPLPGGFGPNASEDWPIYLT